MGLTYVCWILSHVSVQHGTSFVESPEWCPAKGGPKAWELLTPCKDTLGAPTGPVGAKRRHCGEALAVGRFVVVGPQCPGREGSVTLTLATGLGGWVGGRLETECRALGPFRQEREREIASKRGPVRST